MVWFYLFIIFAFLGWILELLFRSWETHRLAVREFHWRLPFLPIYGFGALYLAGIKPVFQGLPFFARGLMYAAALTGIEFCGGVFCELFFNKRFWDYSKKPFNIYGHVDLEAFVYWYALGLAFEKMIFPFSLKILAYLQLV